MGEQNELEPELYGLRYQAKRLERDLYTDSQSGVDDVEARAESIRRRLELLKQNVRRPFE